MARWFAVVICIAAGGARADGLLEHQLPVRSGATPADEPRFTDGVFGPEGAAWDSSVAVTFSVGTEFVWDLKTPGTIAELFIQADNNDEYVVSCSADGVSWQPAFIAQPVSEPGLRARKARGSCDAARFIRLEGRGGDGRFSVSELVLRATATYELPDNFETPLAWGLWVAIASVVFWRARKDGAEPSRAPAVVVIGFVVALVATWPRMRGAGVDFGRLFAALGAVAPLILEARIGALSAEQKRIQLTILSCSAALAVLCFTNFAQGQFRDQRTGAPTFLHHYDMRTYFLASKYLPELGFDGLYVASAVVVEEDAPALLTGALIRDLRDHAPSSYDKLRDHAAAVRARFSADRWQDFKRDVAYFRAAMGDLGFVDSMRDHGANASPVWFLAANLLFRAQTASDFVLWQGLVLDVGGLALAFFCLWRAFGLRTTLIGLTLFGAVDFYQFGTNWFGATLRHDWLALWCISVACLKLKRFGLAGALLAWSALIRAFPAIAFVTVFVVPAFVLVLAVKRREAVRVRLREQAWFARFAGGAAVASLVLIAGTFVTFGPGVWLDWWAKVSMLNAGDYMNSLSVRSWITGHGAGHLAFAIVAVVIVAVTARQRPPEVAAALGVVLVPIVFSPANYYLHAVFILAVCGVAADEKPSPRSLLVWIILLAMCVASFFTRSSDIAAHFRADTYVLIGALALLLVALNVREPAAKTVPATPAETM